MAQKTPLWRPSEERVKSSQLHSFMVRMAERHGIAADWEGLRVWSIEQRGVFWQEVLDFADVRAHCPAERAFDGDGMLDTRWFPGMRLNYAEHLLRFDDDRVAIYFESEIGESRSITYRVLRQHVARFAAALRGEGVKSGDRVGGFMPNMPETVIAMLAASSIGAIWSSCSPDFGINGVLDRFGQIEPIVLVTADGYPYNGKTYDSLERVAGVLERLPSVRRVVVVPYESESPDISKLRDAVLWDEFTAVEEQDPALTFESLPFDHPLFIMYSSGTTGTPKCIVHGAGGTLVQHMKELMLHCDLRREDVILYFTTCGWMMWNWLISSLGVGATVVLYDGSPAYPRISRLWEMTERVKISVFGTSPKFIAACQKGNLQPADKFDLSKLRCLLSTGSPLSVEQFEWIYKHIKGDLQLSSISGGTDIISCFMLGNPILPVYAGEIQCRGLGMDVHAFDDQAKPTPSRDREGAKPVIGKKGELVCCKPFPSQPIYFWNDPDQAKYRSAYFEHYDGIWRHGDFIEITDTGGIIVHGRSDATLNPGGVRIGTAEIYRVVEVLDEVVDSIVVGKRVPGDVEVALFVVLREGATLDQELIDKIKGAIAAGATKRHVPKYIRQVTAIPHTISGKKVELAVAQMIHGEEIKNRDALANPEALDQFREIV
ncbi:MAG: acetoacetate--CoA ligase [Planctomycetes bacterium]|nr:acetoacetate--CoA ligase [Planctomycetota bacterium]